MQREGMAKAVARERERRVDLAWWGRQARKWAAAVAATEMAVKAAKAGVAARWWVRRREAAMRRAVGAAGEVAMAMAMGSCTAVAATVVASAGVAAPAVLCRRAERVSHSQPRHGGRGHGMRLGGGGKLGWVT